MGTIQSDLGTVAGMAEMAAGWSQVHWTLQWALY